MNLENKVEEKPHWSQWIPGYGAIQILQGIHYDKPIIYDKIYLKNNPKKVILCSLYQVPSVLMTIIPFIAYKIAVGKWD